MWDQKKFNNLLTSYSDDIEKRKKRARDGYINPIAIHWATINDLKTTFLLFHIRTGKTGDADLSLVGLLIDNQIYVEEIVARKIRSMELTTIEVAVQDRENKQLLFSSEEIPSVEFEISSPLWIIPNLDIHIKLTGTTLKDIAFSRARTNLIFLGVVNFVLLIGVLYLLRNVRMQMKLAKMQTDFVANVSHELRTPLAVIRMFAETLEMGRVKFEEKKQQYYRSIVGESTRLTQLINNILDFSRIESKKKTYTPIITNIKDLVVDTMDMYQFHLNQKGFKYDLIIEDDLPDLYIDPESVKQAFLNLLENAVKFSFEEKNIIVKLENVAEKVILSVQDFGIGIPESEQTKIFEKFYRAGDAQKYQTKGSGLGLVLVKNIMDKHGGKVITKSKPGKGTTFSLVFPIPNRKGK
jgi:two-component system phosphate regulon sensor histidine kinase PhoR